jgi:O-succinylbenzoic acid--CoA ligase
LSLPAAHVGGFSVITRCLWGRAAVVLPETPFSGTSSDPSALLQAASGGRATLMSLVPTQLHALVEHAAHPPSSLRAVLLGGAPASFELLQRARELGWPVLPSYGLTEACSQVATAHPDTPRQRGVGRALPGVGLRIVDGEIQVSGPTLLSGYLKRDGGLVPALDEQGWLHTGDLGFIDDDGNLVVEGRSAELINTGGEKVFAEKVERCALEHPEVLEACAMGVPDSRWGQKVVLVVVPKTKPESGVVLASLETKLRSGLDAWFSDRLADFERPKATLFTTTLFRGPTGKVARPRLLSWAISQLTNAAKPEVPG